MKCNVLKDQSYYIRVKCMQSKVILNRILSKFSNAFIKISKIHYLMKFKNIQGEINN